MPVVARGRALVYATLAEDRRVAVTVACAAGALLAIDLLGRIAGLGPGFDLVRAGLRLVALPADDTVKNVGARLQPEQGLVQIDAAGTSAVQFDHIEFHSSPSFFSASISASASFRAASSAAACSASAALRASHVLC